MQGVWAHAGSGSTAEEEGDRVRELDLMVSATDYHTAGEPFRIVSGGVAPLLGRTILDKRRYAAEHLDRIRQLLVFEPRGHADMYGCFVTDPEDDGADLGVVFFHNAGYSTACGHGTIALVTWALDTGVLPMMEPETHVIVDVPSGRLPTVATVADGEVTSVRFRNVTSWVFRRGIDVATSKGPVAVDVAYGGAFYGSVPAAHFGLSVDKGSLPELILLGREIKHGIESAMDVVHPFEPELRDIYGVIFHDEMYEVDGEAHQRNVAIFADGEVDRSPCGSGTSARLALLDDAGELDRGKTLIHESITGTRFRASVVGEEYVGGIPGVVTEVEGRAFPTGRHQFALHPQDELGTGFLLR